MISNQQHQEDLTVVKTKILAPAPGAYSYPLLIKSLLLSGARYAPDQEIVYAHKLRYSYRTLNERIKRLANALTQAGVKAGDTVALLDWDSHRYLECFFAVPMIGAVLHTVNIRLSAEQVLYTMNHAEDDLVLVHDDFLPLMEQVHDQLTTVKGYIQLSDHDAPSTALAVLGEYEGLLAQSEPYFDFPDFDVAFSATGFWPRPSWPAIRPYIGFGLPEHDTELLQFVGCLARSQMPFRGIPA